MHKTERWVLFPYLAMDYKAAEDWLCLLYTSDAADDRIV